MKLVLHLCQRSEFFLHQRKNANPESVRAIWPTDSPLRMRVSVWAVNYNRVLWTWPKNIERS
jgi:hypothetical protein